MPQKKGETAVTLRQLKYIITIAETGSFNKAAEILYIAQPSLTSAVKELEGELGITVFNRGGRGATLTPDGAEFILYAREVYGQYESLLEKYGKSGNLKKKFGVSAQHFSFAVKAFVETVKNFDTMKYEFAIRETKTRDVIDDVAHMRSEIGILYLNNFNRSAITKLLSSSRLEFIKLIDCGVYVYLWKGHPLAKRKSIRFSELDDYPCLSFEQGDNGSFFLSEEILSTNEYTRIIKANDRATVCNLMVGLNGYILCSGIICEELNGDDFIAVPFEFDDTSLQDGKMEIGYIKKKDAMLSKIGSLYVKELKLYLDRQSS